jgi:Bifunctional DNA primase/polymerase, N-terminal
MERNRSAGAPDQCVGEMPSLALTYAEYRVKVFPCREGESEGGTSKAPYVEGGLHRASTDQGQIVRWWGLLPAAVPGLPCRSNGIIAIDADRHGREDGVSKLSDLAAKHRFDLTSVPCIATPRNGLHLLFRRLESLGDTKAKIAPGIDVRDNGYIIAAGSVMVNELRYKLLNGTVETLAYAIGNHLLPEMPGWLTELVAKPSTRYRPQTVRYPDPNLGNVRRRLAGLIRVVAFATEGERNHMLYWAACRAGELIRIGLINQDAAIALLTEAGVHAGLTIRETIATVMSGINGDGGARNGR